TNAVNTGSSPRNQYFVGFFEDFLDYIAEHKTPLDFFSWHSYTTTEKNEQYIEYVRESLRNAGCGDTEIICNEWNYNPTDNNKIDRRYGANQTSMLLMFQNAGLDMAHYYCATSDYALHAGMFVPDQKPSSAYYGFWAFGQLFNMKNQVKISGSMPEGMYAVAARDGENAGLLVSNVSEKHDRRMDIVSIGGYEIEKCYTVNDNCEWVQIVLPEKIPAGSILYVTFKMK
ncbi:MAG: hypothetical protein GX851_08290, partial [Clostridiales bacterium]|nr:hypothetical protein [Clostridiales bacterium]